MSFRRQTLRDRHLPTTPEACQALPALRDGASTLPSSAVSPSGLYPWGPASKSLTLRPPPALFFPYNPSGAPASDLRGALGLAWPGLCHSVGLRGGPRSARLWALVSQPRPVLSLRRADAWAPEGLGSTGPLMPGGGR